MIPFLLNMIEIFNKNGNMCFVSKISHCSEIIEGWLLLNQVLSQIITAIEHAVSYIWISITHHPCKQCNKRKIHFFFFALWIWLKKSETGLTYNLLSRTISSVNCVFFFSVILFPSSIFSTLLNTLANLLHFYYFIFFFRILISFLDLTFFSWFHIFLLNVSCERERNRYIYIWENFARCHVHLKINNKEM